jgi:hypothetical protein
MSQAVANTKQFAATTKGKDIRGVLPTPNRPPAKLRKSATDLREEKKRYKAGERILDVEATKEKTDQQTASRFGRYFDDTSIFSRQWTPEAMAEAEKIVGDFKAGPHADSFDYDTALKKVESTRINAPE